MLIVITSGDLAVGTLFPDECVTRGIRKRIKRISYATRDMREMYERERQRDEVYEKN